MGLPNFGWEEMPVITNKLECNRLDNIIESEYLMAYINGKNTETGEKIENLFEPEELEEEQETSHNETECIEFANYLMDEVKRVIEEAKERKEDPDVALLSVLSSEARNWASTSLIFRG